mmetsp:Transcript_10790/g.27316  ORF Transcript_10790/g.27316 Transcript_10790/m.27316 type:complete len:205 (+) Transcript_10790:244-858(+)
MANLEARMAMGPFWEICAARSSALVVASFVTTSLANPHSKASFPVSFFPVQINSLAFADPINRGRRCVPPAPGTMASVVSGSPRTAASETIRKSVASASSSPPPTATPSIAARVGMGNSAMRCIVFLNKLTNSWVSSSVIVARSLRSAPAEKTLSEKEVTTRHRQLDSVSFSKTSRQAPSSRIICWPMAFALGRFRVSLVIVFL